MFDFKPSWTTIESLYSATLSVDLSEDENPDNNEISAPMEVSADIITFKPLYEEFTSSTCIPCASQNPVLDSILGENPGTHSLVKYQMNWPGEGDPYYTEEGGVRRNYYNLTGVPKLFINAEEQNIGGYTQEKYDSFIGLFTGMSIDIISAEIDDDNILTVLTDIKVVSEYQEGLTARMVVIEKITTGNIATNGETEFYHVMLKMMPDAYGTNLPSLTPGVAVQINSDSFV